MESMDGAALDGVSATTLWTLRNRADGASGPDPVIEDPLAIALHQAISYDYDRFGTPSQSHPLRAVAFDTLIREYVARRPRATVVALGEGLQTSLWRIEAPDITWLSVDLAPVMALRARLLPADSRLRSLPMSALDTGWMDLVAPADGVIITAEGLLMYFEPDEALDLISECARRFPGARFVFDSIPSWFSKRTLTGLKLSPGYTAPRMPFSLSRSQALGLPGRIAGVVAARDVMLPPGRGSWGNPLLRGVANAPVLRNLRPIITELTFG